MEDYKKCIFILGSTCSGKTTVGIELAKLINNCEIVSIDAVQAYKTLYIGSNRINESEMCDIPHHMLGIYEITEIVTAAQFSKSATACIQKILQKGKIPIILVGSFFYLKCLLNPLPAGLEKSELIRNRLSKYPQNALFKTLQCLDSEYSKTITCNDRQKTIRALEKIVLSSKKISIYKPGINLFEKSQFFKIYKNPNCILKDIETRTNHMLLNGILDETKKYILCNKIVEKNGILNNSIGYKECIEYLNKKITLEQCKLSIIENTMRLVKYQLKWMKLFKYNLKLKNYNCLDTAKQILIFYKNFI